MTKGLISSISAISGEYWQGRSTLYYEFYTSLTSNYVGKSPLTKPSVYYDDPGVFQSFSGDESAYAIEFMSYISTIAAVNFAPADLNNPQDIGIGAVTIPGNSSLYGQASHGEEDGANPNGQPHEFVEAGDVWLSGLARQDQLNDSPTASIKRKDAFQFTFGHELGHALGLEHSFYNPGNTPVPPLSEQGNSSKFTIMSYDPHLAEGFNAYDFQLYDIANIQKFYGANFSTRNDDTFYGGFGDLAFHEHDPDQQNGQRIIGGDISGAYDRLMSIWDGGGTDTIDASAYDQSARIDLRPGHFSSIGPDAFTDRAGFAAGSVDRYAVTYGTGDALGRENISIAFGAYIENAVGGNENDVIVGNMLSNQLFGGAGQDLLFADGFAIELADEVLQDLGLDPTGLHAELDAESGADADYRQIEIGGVGAIGSTASAYVDDRTKQQDMLIGGFGDDLLAGSDGHDLLYGDSGDDLLIGGGGEDYLEGADGSDLLFGGEESDVLLGGGASDLLMGGSGNDRLIGGEGDDQDHGGDTPGDPSDDVRGGVYGGDGDDVLVAELNDGDDHFHGGDESFFGADTIVYKYYGGDSVVRITEGGSFNGQAMGDFGLSISNAQDETGSTGNFGSDTLTSIEKAAVEAGSGADTLVIDGKSYYGYLDYVDMGSQGSGFDRYDDLNAAFATTNVTVDLRDASNQTLKVDDSAFFDSTLHLRNVENVLGSAFDDEIWGTNSATGSRLSGNGGKDKLHGGDHADDLHGGSGDDILRGGGGADKLDGGSGADILVVDAEDTIARGELEDQLYWKSFSNDSRSINLLRGGIRTVVVDDEQTQDEQIQAMLNSTDPFQGAMGETYRITGSGDTQGLEITMQSGEVISIGRWEEGEYGIHLETTKRRSISYEPVNFGVAGFPTNAFGLGILATSIINTVLFAVELAIDPNWGNFAGDRFTLTQLRNWAGEPGQPPRSNNILGTGDGETIHGRMTDDRILAGGGDDHVEGGLGDDHMEGGDGNDRLVGGVGGDRLQGGAGDDILEGGAGKDTIVGGAGKDTVLVHAGGGADVIQSDAQDVIRFVDIASSDVTMRTGYTDLAAPDYGSLTGSNFVISSGDDQVTILGATFGSIEFSDGVVKSGAAIMRSALAGAKTNGDDVVLGFATSDGLSGGAGDDYLNGFAGNDRYYFGVGDGHDRIEDSAGISDGIIFGPGIAPEDLVVTVSQIDSGPREGELLARFAISGTDDWLEFVVGDIENVRFANGAVWNRYDIGSRVYDALGTDGDDRLEMLDTLSGTFRPGAGDDIIAAGQNSQADILFGRGSDLDRIELYNDGTFYAGRALITLDADVSLGDLEFASLGDGISFSIAGTNDRVEVARNYDPEVQSNWRTMDIVLTSGGVRLTAPTLERIAHVSNATAQRLDGTSGDDALTGGTDSDWLAGGDGADTLDGAAGADLLFGGAGDDVLSGGDHRDMLFGEAGDDQLDGGAGDDALFASTGTDTLLGGLGNDELTGNGQSTLNGGVGDDVLRSGPGDTIVYNLGDGSDVVFQTGSTSGVFDGSTDVQRSEIQLGAGIDPLTTTLTLEGWSLYIDVNGSSSERIRLDRVFQRGDLPQIHFSDGTIWNEAEIFERLFSPNDGDTTVTGITSVEPDWNDRLIRYIYGGAGTDTLNGSSQSGSEHRFVFAPGSGTDTIASAGKVQLFGFDPDQMVLSRSGTGFRDFTISFIGTTDVLHVNAQATEGGGSRIDEFIFSGTTLRSSDLRNLWIAQSTTGGDDTIIGFDGPGGYQDVGIVPGTNFLSNPGNDRLQGGLGNDTMIGGKGDDTYVINPGDGVDIVRDIGLFNPSAAAGNDVLVFGALSTDATFGRSTSDANDLIITFAGSADQITVDEFFGVGVIEEFEFGDGVVLSSFDIEQLVIAGAATSGADTITGSAAPETLTGGAGDDTLDGLGGSDRYVFNLGDGQDIVADSSTSASNTLAFGVGIAAEDLIFEKIGDDLKVTFSASDNVTIIGQFSGSATRAINQIVLSDGTNLDALEIDQLVLSDQATAGGDVISGFASDDTIAGGAGNDTLDGKGGADVYLFARGDGQDIVTSTGDSTAADIVRFAGGITSRDVAFERPTPTSPDLIVHLRGTTQSVTIADYFGGLAVKQFEFADGMIFAAADVVGALANEAPTATADPWRMTVAEGGRNRVVVPDGLFDDDGGVGELRYTATLDDGSALPAWLQFDGNVFEANADDAQVGTHTIKLTAVDAFGDTIDRLVQLDVLNSEETPTATGAVSSQDAALDQEFSYSLPAGLFTDQDTVFSATPTIAAGTYSTEQGGSFVVQLDGTYSYTPAGSYVGDDRVFVPFDVGTAQNLHVAFDFTSTGAASAGVLPTGLVPDQDSLSVTARLANGDALPAWLSFDGVTFSGTPTLGDAGPLAVEIVATDDTGRHAVLPFAIRVGTDNGAPVANSLPGVTATQGEAFSFTVPAATFSDGDANDRLTIGVTLDDGSPLPSWLSFNGTTLSGIPENGDVGSLNLRFTATDIFGETVSITTALNVVNVNDAPVATDPIADQLATQGEAFSFSVPLASFADPDIGDTLTLSATLDTGETLPSWLSFVDGVFSGTPQDADNGLLRVRVTATDSTGLTADQFFILGVADTNDAPVVAESLDDVLAPVGMTTVLRIPSSLFADSDDPGYSVSVSLADGSNLPSWIVFDPNEETITFDPSTSDLYGKSADAATFELRITATDTRGASSSTILSASVGAPNVTSTITGSGSGTINGTSASERIVSGPEDNRIVGGQGVDRIVFGRGSGEDEIQHGNYNNSYPLGDIVEFGPDITLADLTFQRVGSSGTPYEIGANLRISINGTDDHLTIDEQFIGELDEEPTVREFVFADGTRLSHDDILGILTPSTDGDDTIVGGHQADEVEGGDGNDIIYGFNGDDYIDGGAGDDVLIGDEGLLESTTSTGSDTFFFGLGSGNDLIFANTFLGEVFEQGFWQPSEAIDTLRFGAGITPEDLILTHVPGYPDGSRSTNLYTEGSAQAEGSLLIQVAGTSDSVTIDHQFFLEHSHQGPVTTPGIDRFEFADGTVMDRAQFEALITLAPATAGDDIIAGGAAADILWGGLGSDVLVGEDGADTYVYNAGEGDDRILETMQINQPNPIDSATERAGDIISYDTLRFGAGISAEDIIFSRPDDHGENLVISFRNKPGSITIEGQFRNIFHGGNVYSSLAVTDYFGLENAAIDQFVFADGTTWSTADIYAYSKKATDGDDVIDGFFRPSETLDGGAGNDYLVGRNGDDTYVFGRGYGDDTIKEYGWHYSDNPNVTTGDRYTANDKITFLDVASTDVTTSIGAGGSFVFTLVDTGETLTIRPESEFANFTSIIFSDTTWNAAQFQARWNIASATSGDDTIYGFTGNDTIDGGDGNDTLQGGQNPSGYGNYDTLNGGLGNDALILESGDTDRANGGDGDDTFTIEMALAHPLRIDLEQSPFGTETGIIDGGEGYDTLVLGGTLADYWDNGRYVDDNGSYHRFAGGLRVSSIETVQFADATLPFALIASATEPFLPNPLVGTDGNDVLGGTSDVDGLYGLDGNDVLNGLDDDDVLVGGRGEDVLNGSYGEDTYRYELGDGDDQIGEIAETTTTDRLVFGAGIAASDIVLERVDLSSGSSATTVILGDGSRIDLGDQEGGAGVDEIIFDNGAVWNRSEIESRIPNPAGQPIVGTAGADNLAGGAQDDELLGLGGNDELHGQLGNDSLDGGSGNDALYGDDGNDRFIYRLGDGDDVIAAGESGDLDTLVFDASIGETDVLVSTDNGSDLTLTFSGTSGSVSVIGALGSPTYDFEIEFADGTTWDRAEIESRLPPPSGPILGTNGDDLLTGTGGEDEIHAFAGNDQLFGLDGDDDLYGYTGDDALWGGAGSDQYAYYAGDGNDVVHESSGTFDVLVLVGIASADTNVNTTANTDEVLLTFNGQAGSVLIPNQLQYLQGVEYLYFADEGAFWSYSDVAARASASASSFTASFGRESRDGVLLPRIDEMTHSEPQVRITPDIRRYDRLTGSAATPVNALPIYWNGAGTSQVGVVDRRTTDWGLNAPWLGDRFGLPSPVLSRHEIFEFLREDGENAHVNLFDRFHRLHVDALAQRSLRVTVPAATVAPFERPRHVFDSASDYFPLQAPFGKSPLSDNRAEREFFSRKLDTLERAFEISDEPSDAEGRSRDIAPELTLGATRTSGVNDDTRPSAIANDPELVRKLAMIRQDMGTFGANGAAEADRLHESSLDYLQFYA